MSIQYTQKEVDDMKTCNIKQTELCNSMQADIMKICDRLLVVSDKMEYLEGHSCRSNLVFDSVAEQPGETWVDTVGMVKNVLVDKLLLKKEVEIERAYCTGKPVAGSNKPRSIVVKFLRYKDKADVLERAKNLKGSRIYINEDFTEAVCLKGKELPPKMREARDRGKIVYLRHDKLITRPRNSTRKPPENMNI